MTILIKLQLCLLDLATVWAELHKWPRNVFQRLGGFHGATVQQIVGALAWWVVTKLFPGGGDGDEIFDLQYI